MMVNGRHDHPRARFDRYVEQTWGKATEEMSQDDRGLALADWQVLEMVRQLRNGPHRGRARVVDAAARGGPWAMALSLGGLLVESMLGG